jgi:hypothetical protein
VYRIVRRSTALVRRLLGTLFSKPPPYLRTRPESELAEDVFDVDLHGSVCDYESLSDVMIAVSFCYQTCNLSLAGGESVGRGCAMKRTSWSGVERLAERYRAFERWLHVHVPQFGNSKVDMLQRLRVVPILV